MNMQVTATIDIERRIINLHNVHIFLQLGLEVARLEMFNTVNGARTTAPDVILLITDGVSSHADPNLDPDEQALFKVICQESLF